MKYDEGIGIRFIEINPDFDTVAGRVIDLRSDESEAIDFIRTVEMFSQEEEDQFLIDLLFVALGFKNLEDESSSFLILFIFPFRFDSLPKELDRVDFLDGITGLVT